MSEEGYFWNAGHFSHALREAKRHFKAVKEEIWRAIEKHKASQVMLMAEGWKHSFEWELRTARAEKKI
jgi:mannose-1-phosphate guanylyltransferase